MYSFTFIIRWFLRVSCSILYFRSRFVKSLGRNAPIMGYWPDDKFFVVPLNFTNWYDSLGEEVLYFLTSSGDVFRCFAHQFHLLSIESCTGKTVYEAEDVEDITMLMKDIHDEKCAAILNFNIRVEEMKMKMGEC